MKTVQVVDSMTGRIAHEATVLRTHGMAMTDFANALESARRLAKLKATNATKSTGRTHNTRELG
jgi:hypothetical protein